jgi:hypothetical protein
MLKKSCGVTSSIVGLIPSCLNNIRKLLPAVSEKNRIAYIDEITGNKHETRTYRRGSNVTIVKDITPPPPV